MYNCRNVVCWLSGTKRHQSILKLAYDYSEVKWALMNTKSLVTRCSKAQRNSKVNIPDRHYWPFVMGIHLWLVHSSQWHGKNFHAMMSPYIRPTLKFINVWVMGQPVAPQSMWSVKLWSSQQAALRIISATYWFPLNGCVHVWQWMRLDTI